MDDIQKRVKAESQQIIIILKEFNKRIKPNSTLEIENSDAYIYIYNEYISEKNINIYQQIFGIISANLVNFKKDETYFRFIDKLLKYYMYESSIVCQQINNMSMHKIDDSLSKIKLYNYISVLLPDLSYSIFYLKEYSCIQLFLILLESIFRLNEETLLPKYIDMLGNIMEIYEENTSEDLYFIFANYAYIFRLCANFPKCHPKYVKYFKDLAEHYEKKKGHL